MPQVDLETLVCGGAGDGKVSCETLIDTPPDPDPNLPPESITVPIDLFDLAAAVTYDRDDSAKESTNPKSHAHNPNPNTTNPAPGQWRSNSQRYAAASANRKANGPIIGLPNRVKHVTCTSSRPRADTNSRIFPKKKPAGPVGADASGRKSAVPEYEPSSPKVSWFGRVLSDRERERCRLARRRRGSPGCWAGIAAMFACGGGGREEAAEAGEGSGCGDVSSGNILLRKRNVPLDDDEPAAAPGLGGVKRFASGRRAASWGSDVEEDGGGHVAADLGRRSLDEGMGVGPVAV